MASFQAAGPQHRSGAVEVWRAANAARDTPPPPARVERVAQKLQGAAVCLVVGVDRDEVTAMALAEPAREQHGLGSIQPGAGHVSMVFVAPGRWGEGIGGQLLDAQHRQMRARGWTTSSLWTGCGNVRARQLYERCGYRVTGEVQRHAGKRVVRYQRRLVPGA